MFALACPSLPARELHVAKTGRSQGSGTSDDPFKTITAAAQKALPGDTVTVHEGIYREWVDPLRGGIDDARRIVYRAAEGETVEIKGSEEVTGWKKAGKDLWSATVPNSIFGAFNPFAELYEGDWLDTYFPMHLADVYLDDVSLYEVAGPDDLLTPTRTHRDPDGVRLNWYATVGEEYTTITACFGGQDPNKHTVEISVRPTCFYPTREGLNYITVKGFRISQAATRWGAPTAEQVGMVATHWSKGWIIEDNIIKNSHSNGITLGKEAATGQDVWRHDMRHDGSIHYIETIFRALERGWSKDNVGSHVVRNNIISDCGQTGICGSMGCAFCEIAGNDISNIYITGDGRYNGAEMGGIKFHGAIDAYIHHNRIHHCNRALWLDWMGQGARVSSNLFDGNWDHDIFLEMNHGPMMVDNNIMLSKRAFVDVSEGVAFVDNFIYGCLQDPGWNWNDQRYVPYNMAHSTKVKGISTIDHSDNRFIDNVFCLVGGDLSWELEPYLKAARPAMVEGNVLLKDPSVKLEETDEGIFLTISLPSLPSDRKVVDGERLGVTYLSGYHYENPDGTLIRIDKDYFGNMRPESGTCPGPFAVAPEGSVRIWKP